MLEKANITSYVS